MFEVGLFIIDGTAKRIELFKDEDITITSSIQNISDITKVFTDFSQSFTIPATDRNNAIFKHWYENAIEDGFDARTRKDAYIELGTIPFRRGKIQLEKAVLKNGLVYAYQISFIGSLVSLKDKFNDRYLRDFDFSAYDFTYSGADVKNRITGGVNNDIKFPLISSWNVWQWGTNGSTRENWDINKTQHPIFYTDLFPALRVFKIFDTLAAQLGVTFNGSFLASDRFKRAFLWLKNTDYFTRKSTPNKINFTSVTSTTGSQGLFNVTTDTFTYTKPEAPNFVAQSYLNITFTTAGEEFTIYTYKDGIELNQQTYATETTTMTIPIPLDDSGEYTFYISSFNPVTFGGTGVETTYFFEARTGSNVTYQNLSVTANTTQTTSMTLSVGSYMPNIKAQDFFAGILKMFNLTCYATADNVYQIEQLEAWYDNGRVLPFDEYVIKDEITLEKVDAYQAINFKYKESQNLLATEYLSRSSIPYGDLKYETGAEGEEFNVELPFENLLFNKIDNNIQVSYVIKSDFSTYIPEPIVLYDYGTIQTTGNYHFNDGTSTTALTLLNVFGQDALISGVKYSLNWGAEQSTFTEQIEQNSLFRNYYLNYLSNLFTSKARKVKLRAKMPPSLLNSLALNDRLVIRGKRYIINSFTTNLNTGVSDFELLNDFRVPNQVPLPTIPYVFQVTNGNSTSSADACQITSYSLTIYGAEPAFLDNDVFYSNSTLNDLTSRFNGGGFYYKNAEGKYVVISSTGSVTSSGTCPEVPPTPLFAFQVTNASSTSPEAACPIENYTLTIYGYNSVFVNNVEFFADQNLNEYNGGNYYYHHSSGTWVQISPLGVRTSFGVCSSFPVADNYYLGSTEISALIG